MSGVDANVDQPAALPTPAAVAESMTTAEPEAQLPAAEPCAYLHPEIGAALDLGAGPPGMVHRRLAEFPGETQQAMADALGIRRHMVTWSVAALALLKDPDAVPASQTTARCVRAQLSGFLDRHDEALGDEARTIVSDLVDLCRASEAAAAARQQQVAEDAAERGTYVTGVYVYTLAHYLNHPVAPAEDDFSSDRTLLKVGMSSVDAHQRVRRQSNTGLPEPPMLLRVYACGDDDAQEMERSFHRLLDAFGHGSRRQRGAGKEWFLTSLDALDELADVLCMDTAYSNEDEEDGDDDDDDE